MLSAPGHDKSAAGPRRHTPTKLARLLANWSPDVPCKLSDHSGCFIMRDEVAWCLLSWGLGVSHLESGDKLGTTLATQSNADTMQPQRRSFVISFPEKTLQRKYNAKQSKRNVGRPRTQNSVPAMA